MKKALLILSLICGHASYLYAAPECELVLRGYCSDPNGSDNCGRLIPTWEVEVGGEVVLSGRSKEESKAAILKMRINGDCEYRDQSGNAIPVNIVKPIFDYAG